MIYQMVIPLAIPAITDSTCIIYTMEAFWEHIKTLYWPYMATLAAIALAVRLLCRQQHPIPIVGRPNEPDFMAALQEGAQRVFTLS
jgi:hypothetical protein